MDIVTPLGWFVLGKEQQYLFMGQPKVNACVCYSTVFSFVSLQYLASEAPK